MRRLSTLILALLIIGRSDAQAAWPDDIYTGGVPICVENFAQFLPVSTHDGKGGVIAAWSDLRDGVSLDIYARRVSAGGEALWSPNGVPICTFAGSQTSPRIVSDGVGGAIITWTDQRPGSTGDDLYAQRVDSTGAVLWTPGGVRLSNAAGSQRNPVMLADGAQGAFVVWDDLRSDGGDIFGQRVSASGALLWNAGGNPISVQSLVQRVPAIVSDGTGGLIAAWEDTRLGGLSELYAQRVNSSGSTLWGADILVSNRAGQEREVSLTATPGGAIAAFYANGEVFLQKIGVGGNVQWSPSGTLCAASGSVGSIRSAPDGSGGVVVVWSDGRVFPPSIYAQRTSAYGAQLWSANGVRVSTSSATQSSPALVTDASGDASVFWQEIVTPFGHALQAQRLDASGAALLGPTGVRMVQSVSVTTPSAVVSGADKVIATWVDGRFSTDFLDESIFCQRIDRYGVLGDAEPIIDHVRDVANDQGGYVRVSWSRSYLDAHPGYRITEYRAWRQVATAAAARSARVSSDPDQAAVSGALFLHPFGGQSYAWELVGTQPANALESYSLVAATTSDSVSGSNPSIVHDRGTHRNLGGVGEVVLAPRLRLFRRQSRSRDTSAVHRQLCGRCHPPRLACQRGV